MGFGFILLKSVSEGLGAWGLLFCGGSSKLFFGFGLGLLGSVNVLGSFPAGLAVALDLWG